MSFRSRSRTVQPIVTRRASSLTRTITPSSVNGASSLASTYAGRSYTGPSGITGSSAYGTSGSPLAGSTYSTSSSPYGTTVSTSSPSSRSLLGTGASNGAGTYFDYSNLSRRDSYGGSSSSLAYKSPYKDKDRYGGGGIGSTGGSSSSSYTTTGNSYKDRYVSPYTSYDNGITTASLSLSGLKRHHHLSSNGLSGSNSSLNNTTGYTPTYGSTLHAGSHHHHTAGVGRSQSLRDHERRSRSRTRASQAASSAATMATYPSNSSLSRSYSTTSVQSEGYETGSERGRSRVGSTASELDTASQTAQDSTRENGGDCIDYKALYEQEKADNDKLKMALRKKDEEVVTLKAALDRFTTATTKNNSLSELEKRERRAMERKMSEMEEELKLLEALKTENQRLKDENGALIRVISKLSR